MTFDSVAIGHDETKSDSLFNMLSVIWQQLYALQLTRCWHRFKDFPVNELP